MKNEFQSKFFESVYPPKLVKSDESLRHEWEQLKDANFDSIGRILTCHLLIEHYLNNYLYIHSKNGLNITSVKLTFSQKIEIVSGKNSLLRGKKGLCEGLKQLNRIRNNISHNLVYKLEFADVEKLLNACEISTEFKTKIKNHPIAIIELFTSLTCSFLAGVLSTLIEID